jgi:hypothetical protein
MIKKAKKSMSVGERRVGKGFFFDCGGGWKKADWSDGALDLLVDGSGCLGGRVGECVG